MSDISVELLKKELEKRIRDNPRYSLRSFAQSMNMAPSGLSMVFTGKRKLSIKKRSEIVRSMSWTIDEINNFIFGVNELSASSNNKPSRKINDSVSNWMELDTFDLVSNWLHFGLLALFDLKDIPHNHKAFAKALGSTEFEVTMAIDRLKRLGLAYEDSNGRLQQKGGSIRFKNSHSTAATIRFNIDLLKKAIISIQNDSFLQRSAAANIFSVDERELPNMRTDINQFRNYLAEKYSSKGGSNQVYCLALQCFPITKKNKKIKGE